MDESFPFLYAHENIIEDEAGEYVKRFYAFMKHSFLFLLLKTRSTPLRILGYAENTVPQFTTTHFKFHFRISKEMFEIILQQIGGELLPTHGGGSDETDPSKQVLLFLWYIANQQSMREISHVFDVSMSTVHATLKRVNNAINRKLWNWPDFNEQNEIAREFQLRCGLPDIIGVLDGTHIRLASCINGDSDYMNRKHFPSIQLQIVVDHDMLIRDVYTGWPGSTHDARVFRNSNLFTNATTGNCIDVNKYIIADSAYPLKQWLITPFKDNGRLNAQQRRRFIVHRTIRGLSTF